MSGRTQDATRPGAGASAAGGRRTRVATLVLSLVLAAAAHAQPMVAGGGFGRPFRVATTDGRSGVALAELATGPTAVWFDGSGVLRRPLAGTAGAAAQRLVQSPSVRLVSAAGVGGELVLAWAERDRATGHTLHYLSWSGGRRLLADANRPWQFVVVRGSGTPLVAFAPRSDGEAALQLVGEHGAGRVVHRSTLAVTGIDAVQGPDGTLWLSWLEGVREATPLGVRSDWTAYVVALPAGGAPSRPLAVGRAGPREEADGTRLGPGTAGAAGPETNVLFPGEDGTLLAVAVRLESGDLVEAGPALRLGRGRAVGVGGGDAFWSDGASLRRRPLAGGPVVNVALSPVTVLSAALLGDGGTAVLAWQGQRTGGGSAIYASRQGEVFRASLADRVAAAMGWNPYFVWAEAAGQALTALLIGVLGTAGLTPLLWLASLIAAPALKVLDPRALGSAVAALLLVALWVVLATRSTFPPGTFAAEGGGVWSLPVAVLAAGAISAALLRRGDRETATTVVLASLLTTFLALALASFATFRAWAPLVGLTS